MVDYSEKAYERIGRHHPTRSRVGAGQAAKLDAKAARTYTDDAVVQYGALSAPRIHFRPGQRDDEVH